MDKKQPDAPYDIKNDTQNPKGGKGKNKKKKK